MRQLVKTTGVVWGLSAIAAVAVLACAVNLVVPSARPRSWYAAAVGKTRPTPPQPPGPEGSAIWTTKLGREKIIQKRELRLDVAGVTLSPSTGESVAFVNIGSEQRRVREGDEVDGALVKRITVDAVVVDDAGEEKAFRVRPPK